MSMRIPFSALACALGIACTTTQAQTISAVMHASLRSVDPNITTAHIVRNYAYMVYDTLLALDADLQIRPQMAESWKVSPDGKTYTFTLREGLKWHDGADVTAEDCVASIQRWSALDKTGQVMGGLMSDMRVEDARTFSMVFKEPTDIALRALSKSSGVTPFMMPKRVAQTPVSEPIRETVGSGPFRFVAGEYRPGVQAVFARNEAYVPRAEPASGLAGGKVVKVDRVKWISMPDMMTAVNALGSGEIDFIEQVSQDLIPMLDGNADVVLQEYRIQGSQNIARVNTKHPPFDNKLIRQAAMLALDQKDILQAQVGNPKYYQPSGAMLGSASPFASKAGENTVVSGDPAGAAALLKQANYDGTPVVILHPTDVAALAAMPPVIAQALRKAGFTVELQAMDWQTVTTRRTSKEPASNGGWSIFSTYNNLTEVGDPVGSITVAANGDNGWFGWPDVPQVEALRARFVRANDTATKQQIAEDIQKEMVDQAYSLILGEFSVVTAKRKVIHDQVNASVPVFWNMTKSGK